MTKSCTGTNYSVNFAMLFATSAISATKESSGPSPKFPSASRKAEANRIATILNDALKLTEEWECDFDLLKNDDVSSSTCLSDLSRG